MTRLEDRSTPPREGTIRLLSRAALVVALGLIAGPPCRGQEAPPPEGVAPGAWQDEIERLRRRLDELERWKAAQDAAPPPPSPAGDPERTGDDAVPPTSPPVDPAPPDDPAPADPLAPDPLDDSGEDLDDLLGKQHPSTDFGSFGIRLTQYGVEPYLHGYISETFVATHDFPRIRTTSGSRATLESSFLLSEFAVIVGANIKDTVIPEVQFVYETGTSGSDVDPRAIHLRYGQVDLHVNDLLTIRAGKFLVPFGRYNESLYPDFLFPINRSLLQSFVNIVPVVWADTGVQLRGRYRIAEDVELNYAAYVMNGLGQTDSSTVPGVVADGGSIQAMRRNSDIDLRDGGKWYGGRVGLKAWNVDAGLSVVGGRYTPDDRQTMVMGGYYLYFHWRGFSLGTEGVLCEQERASPNSDLRKRGGFAYVAYRFFEVPVPVVRHEIDIEPVIAVDYSYLGEGLDSTLYMGGLQFYFLPEDLPNAKLSFTGGALDSFTQSSMLGLFFINLSVAF